MIVHKLDALRIERPPEGHSGKQNTKHITSLLLCQMYYKDGHPGRGQL